eukprot:1148810-Pelagomonas_calceolata.AAC.1
MDSALHILSGCQCPIMRNMALLGPKKKKKKKLRRQRKPSLHQLRKERHIGSKSHESPSPEDERGVNVDQ